MKKRAYIIVALMLATMSIAGCGSEVANNGGVSAGQQGSVAENGTNSESDSQGGESVAIDYDNIAFEDITPMPTSVEEFESLPNAPKVSTVVESFLSDAVTLLNEDKPLEAVDSIMEGYEQTSDDALLFFAEEMKLRVYVKSETTTYQDGDVVKIEYDERGNIISYEGSDSKYVNTYDEDGHLVAAKTYDGDEVVVTEDYEYDSHGNQVKSTIKEFDVVTIRESEYDENNNVTHAQVTTGGKVTSVEDYTYFDDDNLCSEMGFYETYSLKEYEDGKLVGETFAQNDEYGNEILYRRHTPIYSEEDTSEFKYDKNGKILRRIDTADGCVPNVSTYEYDKNGNLIKEDVQSGEGDEKSVIHYEYAYDENGNAIEYKCTIDDSEAIGGFIAWNRTEYDKDQRISKYTELGWDEKPIYEMRYTYFEDGTHKMSELGFDGEGNITYESTSYYNKGGYLTLTETDHSRSEYVYDSLGNILSYVDDNYGYKNTLVYGMIQ